MMLKRSRRHGGDARRAIWLNILMLLIARITASVRSSCLLPRTRFCGSAKQTTLVCLKFPDGKRNNAQ